MSGEGQYDGVSKAKQSKAGQAFWKLCFGWETVERWRTTAAVSGSIMSLKLDF